VRGEVSGKTAVVHEAVVVAAEQGGVGEVGEAAVEPVGQVVRLSVSACPIERNLGVPPTEVGYTVGW